MTKKFRASLLTGMGVLSLAAVGCGGGGGASLTVDTPAKIVIGASKGSVSASINSVGGGSGLRYSLADLSGKDVFPQDVEVYSMDGEILSGVTVTCLGNKLPCTAALDAAALAKAQTQNGLVFRVKSGNLDYKAVAPDLSGLRKGVTHSERIGVGFSSTLVTALVEDEMSNVAGEQVVLGRVADPEQSMKLRNFLDDASRVDLVQTVKTFRAAMEDAGSALAEMSQDVSLYIDPANADAAGGLDVAIRKFALEGENLTGATTPAAGRVNAVRQVKSVAAKMVSLTKSETNAARKDKLLRLLDSVAKANQADASVKSAAGNLVANTVSASNKVNGLTASLDEVLAKIDSGAVNNNVAKSLVQETGEKVLPAMNNDVVQALSKVGEERLFAQITGGVMAGSDYIDDADKKTELAAKAGARLIEIVDVLSPESQKNVLGAAMGAASASAAAVANVVQVAVSKGANIVELIGATQKSGDANVADIVRAVTEYAATDEGKEALNVASATAFLQSVVGTVGAANVALVQNRRNIVLADQAKIEPATVEVKVGQNIILSNASVAGNRTKSYTYKWKSATGAVLSTNSSVFTTVAAAASTYKIYLEQSSNGTAVDTAKANVTVLAATALKAPVLISSRAATDRLDIFKARSATVNLDVLEPEATSTRALTIKANVVVVIPGASGGVVAKWGTKALSGTSGAQTIACADAVKGLRIPVTIDAVTEGEYAIDFVLGYGSAGEVKRTVNVRVNPPAPKVVSFVGLPASHIATTDLTINASLYSEQTSGTVTMKLKIDGTLFRTWDNLTVSAGSTAYTTVLSGGTIMAQPGSRTFELSLEESSLATRYATKTISVYEQGAPVITGLRLARKTGTTVGTKTSLVNGATYTVSTTNPTALVLNLEVLTSTETGAAVPTSYSVVKTGWSTSGTSATTDIVNITPAPGVVEYTVTAAAGGKTTSWKFFVDVRKIYEVTVSSLSISGAQGTAAGVQSVVAGVLPFDADGLTGVTMINQGLKVVLVTTETSTTPEVYDSNVRLVVELADPASVRRASMTIEGATFALTSTGFNITTAASVIAGAVRSDDTEVSRTLDADKVTDFAGLFTPSTFGTYATIEINVYKLKEAIKEILVSNYPDFAGRIDAMTGENMSLSISVTPSRMILKSGASQINGFAFTNIDVE